MNASSLFKSGALGFSALIALSGCGPQIRLVGSGNIVTQEPTIEDFTEIDASHSFKVKITQGSEFGVEVRAHDNVMEHVEVKKDGDELDLGLKTGNYSTKNVTLEADVTMPKLKGVDLSGASKAELSGFDSEGGFEADLSGASLLKGELKCGVASFDVSGASSVELKGSAETLKVDASGASSANFSAFDVTVADVDASGASNANVKVTGKLDAEASGASKIVYQGNPKLGKSEKSGASSIKAK